MKPRPCSPGRRAPDEGRCRAVRARFGILSRGEVSEWLMVPLSKSGVRKHRGFESRPLRHNPPAAMAADACVVASGPRSRTFGYARSGPRLRLRLDHPHGGLTSRAGGRAAQSGCAGGGMPLPCLLGERSPSGLWRRTGNAVWGNPSRVRIPPSPPLSAPPVDRPVRALAPPVLADVRTVGPMVRGASPRTSGGCTLAPALGRRLRLDRPPASLRLVRSRRLHPRAAG